MNARQWSVVSGQWSAPPGGVPRLRAYGRRTTDYGLRRAFSLVELLIVIGIIVLIAMIAVPSFRALSGGRSTEAAENTISAVLARARTEALGLQEPRGVLFYRDIESGRVGMAMVRGMPPLSGDPVFPLDLVPNRDPVLLPIGVGIQFVDDDITPAGGTDADRFIGFNTRINRTLDTNPDATMVPYGGVVMFDGKGRLATETYGFRIRYPGVASEMGRFLYDAPDPDDVPASLIVIPSPDVPLSKLGFVLFNEEDFSAVFREDRGTDMTEDQDWQHDNRLGDFTQEAEEEDWLSENGVPILVNRYNGTLVRGE